MSDRQKQIKNTLNLVKLTKNRVFATISTEKRERTKVNGRRRKTFLSHFTLINDNSNQLLVATVHARRNCVQQKKYIVELET